MNEDHENGGEGNGEQVPFWGPSLGKVQGVRSNQFKLETAVFLTIASKNP